MDYLPRKDANLIVWLSNYKNKIVLHGSTIGLSATEITNEQAICDNMINSINNVANIRDQLKAAVAKKDSDYQQLIGALRTNISRHKKDTGYSTSIGEDLGVIGIGDGFNPTTYKPSLKIEIFGGFVRIKFSKSSTDGVNLYHRRKGQAEWSFLARDTKSPYDDHIVLSIANQPEHWEYRAYGVIDDEEIGLASDIVEVVFGG